MNKRIFTTWILIILIGFILMSTITTVSADGGLFIPFSYEHIYQPSQKAVIIYNSDEGKGKEDLILQVKYEQGAENFAWVVPVPDYPAVNKSDAKLFEELYHLTTPYPRPIPGGWLGGGGGKEAPGVELLERKRVGIYDVSILSATDPSALIEWLNENGYNFPEEAESIIDFYIAKEWYFVAMRIDLEAEKQDILDKFKEIDSSIDTVEDAKRYLPEKVAEDVAECKSYNESIMKKLAEILWDEERNDGLPVYITLYITYWVDGHHNKTELVEWLRFELERDIEDKFEEMEESLNEGTIQPIKLSFNSSEIIYPLRMTALNPGSTEVLLYVFADCETQIDNFSVEYAEWVYPEDVKYTKALKEIVTREYFLTKMRRNFSQEEMDDDLVVEPAGGITVHAEPFSIKKNPEGEVIMATPEEEVIIKYLLRKKTSNLIEKKNTTEYNTGVELVMSSKYKEAITAFNKSIELNPNIFEAYFGRGFAYHCLNQYERAIRDYNKTIEMDPNIFEAYFARGLAYADLRQLKEAMQDYNKTIAINPNCTVAYYNRGVVYVHLEDGEKAKDDFKKVLEIAPPDSMVYKNAKVGFDYINEVASPGFEAVFAFAGLLGVAYLAIKGKRKKRGD